MDAGRPAVRGMQMREKTMARRNHRATETGAGEETHDVPVEAVDIASETVGVCIQPANGGSPQPALTGLEMDAVSKLTTPGGGAAHRAQPTGGMQVTKELRENPSRLPRLAIPVEDAPSNTPGRIFHV